MISHETKANENLSKVASNRTFGKGRYFTSQSDFKNTVLPKITINQSNDFYEQEA